MARSERAKNRVKMAGTIKSRFGVVKLGTSAPDAPLAAVDAAPPLDTPPASPPVSAKNAFANSARPIDSEIIVRADPHFVAPSEAPRGVQLTAESEPAVTAAAEQPAFGDYSRLASIPVPTTEEPPLEIGSSPFGGYGSPMVTVTPKRFDLAGELYQRIKGALTDPPETKSPYTLADKVGHCLITQGLRRFFREVSKGGGEPTPIGNPAERAVKEILPTTACRLGSNSLSIEPGGQGGASVTVNIATPASLKPNTGSVNTWLSIGGSPGNPSIRAGLELRF